MLVEAIIKFTRQGVIHEVNFIDAEGRRDGNYIEQVTDSGSCALPRSHPMYQRIESQPHVRRRLEEIAITKFEAELMRTMDEDDSMAGNITRLTTGDYVPPSAISSEGKADRQRVLSPMAVTALLRLSGLRFQYWSVIREMVDIFIEHGDDLEDVRKYFLKRLMELFGDDPSRQSIFQGCNEVFGDIYDYHCSEIDNIVS